MSIHHYVIHTGKLEHQVPLPCRCNSHRRVASPPGIPRFVAIVAASETVAVAAVIVVVVGVGGGGDGDGARERDSESCNDLSGTNR